MKKTAALPAAKARFSNRRIGSIGSGARRSQATKAPISARPPAREPTISRLPHPAMFARTSAQTIARAPALTSARPRRSSPVSEP